MASEKERRDKTTKEREIYLEKERVPKMTTHVESLSEKVNKPGETPSEEEVGRILPAGRQAVGKFEMNVGEAGGDEGKRTAALELEEISKFRQQAQQNSLEAIKAAEERYQKAHGKEKDAQLAKDATSEKSRQGGYTTAAKDTLTTAGKTAADYTKQTAGKAKDAAVSGGETAVHYVGDKAVAAKEASVETGKGAAGYAGKKAAELKEKAMATGWGAAHYTSQKAVEATKAVAGAIQSTAEYTDEKVVDYTGRKREAAKQDLAAINKSSETKSEEMPIRDTERKRREGHGFGGVLEAMGETVLEIAQVTKELVIGKDEPRAGYGDDDGQKGNGNGESHGNLPNPT